jgi:hypothetical protein
MHLSLLTSLPGQDAMYFNFIGQWYGKEEEFLAMFDKATSKPRTCLMYTNRAETIEDSFMSFKAPFPQEFSIEFTIT